MNLLIPLLANTTIIYVAFFVGFIYRIAVPLYKKITLLEFVGFIVTIQIPTFLFLVLAPTLEDTDETVAISLGLFCLQFIIWYPRFFYRYIIPTICEKQTLQFIILSWYILWEVQIPTKEILTGMLVLMTLVSVLFLLHQNTTSLMAAGVQFTIFCLTNICIAGIPFVYIFTDQNVSFDIVKTINPLNAFLLGINLCYLTLNISMLLYLIPEPMRHQSIKVRLKEWHLYMETIIKNYTDNRESLRYISTFLVIEIVALALNAYFKVISPLLMVNLILAWIQSNTNTQTHEGKGLKPLVGNFLDGPS